MIPRNLLSSLFSLLVFVFIMEDLQAQDSAGIYWQRCLGGTGYESQGYELIPDHNGLGYVSFDNGQAIMQKSDIAVSEDGSSLLVTTTWSKDGDLKGLRKYSDTASGGSDVFVTRLDPEGRSIWKKCFGGSKYDMGTAAYALPDGYLIAGATMSGDGDFNNPYTSYYFPFIIKVDFNGNVIWKRVYTTTQLPSSSYCMVEKIKKSPDGTFYLVANWNIYNGDYHPNDRFVAYLLQVSSSGDKLWEGTIGGNSHTIASSIEIPTDSTILLAGYTLSSSGTIVSPWPNQYNGFLTLLKKAMYTGYVPIWTQFQWLTNGSQHTKILDMVQTSDGSIYAAGTYFDNNREQEMHGIIYKYDKDGNRKWFKRFQNYKAINALDTATDGGIIFLSFQVPGWDIISYGSSDVHVIRLDSQANINWKKYYPGTRSDFGMRIKYRHENELYLLAVTNSDSMVGPNHNKKNPVGYDPNPYRYSSDVWALKVGPNNLLQGKVFVDWDKNGRQEWGEQLVRGTWVKTGKTNQVPVGTFAADGTFKLSIDTGTYITRPVLPSPDLPFNIKPLADTFTFTNRGNIRNLSFALQPTKDICDAAIDITPLSLARLGREITYRLTYSNKGTQFITAPVVSFVKDPRLSIVRIHPSPAKITGDTLSWNVSSMDMLNITYIDLTFKAAIPPQLNLNDTLKLSARISHSQTDAIPSNNEKKIEHIIIGAFDPNDKTEIHNGKLYTAQYNQGDYLTYRINFQNIGNDTAFTVEIRDTLEQNLDVSDLTLIGSSHKCSVTLKDNRVIIWKFYEILLTPQKVNDSLSMGYVTFRIKPKAGFPTGHSFQNKAAIYFDYNDPVITNTATTTISIPPTITGVIDVTNPANKLILFPNPTTRPALQVLYKGARPEKFDIVVYDAGGNTVYRKAGKLLVPGQSLSLPMNNLKPGIYYVHFSNNSAHAISKWVYSN